MEDTIGHVQNHCFSPVGSLAGISIEVAHQHASSRPYWRCPIISMNVQYLLLDKTCEILTYLFQQVATYLNKYKTSTYLPTYLQVLKVSLV
jgi:hypothetical protein